MPKSWYNDPWIITGTIIFALLIQAFVLHLFGQPPICTCDYVKLWEGVVSSGGNSQHITDWYTLSHVIHGFLFYLLLRTLFPRMPVLTRLLLAVGIEIAWEITENTPWLIEHYRQQALAQGYVGDSILNSLSDTVAMIAGFLLVRHTRWWLILMLAIMFEAFTVFYIRDGLVLNILGFFYIPDFIHSWQSAEHL